MALNVSIARRYARALLEAVSGHSGTDTVADQLEALGAAVRDHRELAAVFHNPGVSRIQRQAVAEQLLKLLAPVEKSVDSLVRLLVDRDRLAHLPDIARSFRELADARAGRVRGEVVSAAPLSAELVGKVEQALERSLQRDVVLTSRVDPTLIGGVSTRVGSMTFDGSLHTQLETLRRQLKQA